MLWLLIGCVGRPDDTGTPLSVDAPDEVRLNDENGGITVSVEAGSAPGWSFGAAWPDIGLTAEACLGEDDVCHTLDASGGFIALELCEVPADGLTCIPVEHYRVGRMSFVLKPSIGAGCWVWGDEAAYWDDLGCTLTDWSPESF